MRRNHAGPKLTLLARSQAAAWLRKVRRNSWGVTPLIRVKCVRSLWAVAAIKLFRGPRRWIAALATLMSCALVPFAGVVLVIPAVIAVIALFYRYQYGREPATAKTSQELECQAATED
jgi:hypothetical protein